MQFLHQKIKSKKDVVPTILLEMFVSIKILPFSVWALTVVKANTTAAVNSNFFIIFVFFRFEIYNKRKTSQNNQIKKLSTDMKILYSIIV